MFATSDFIESDSVLVCSSSVTKWISLDTFFYVLFSILLEKLSGCLYSPQVMSEWIFRLYLCVLFLTVRQVVAVMGYVDSTLSDATFLISHSPTYSGSPSTYDLSMMKTYFCSPHFTIRYYGSLASSCREKAENFHCRWFCPPCATPNTCFSVWTTTMPSSISWSKCAAIILTPSVISLVSLVSAVWYMH